MKPIYFLLLLWAIFITGLADGISFGLAPIPGVGFVLGFAVAVCINATMGAGLILALVSQNMFHPRIGPFGITLGLIPGLNFLPFWVGLVIAGIVYKMNAEGEALGKVAGTALKLQSVYQGGGNPFAAMKAAGGIVMNERRATGRPETANDNQPPTEAEGEAKSRAPINLKSPGLQRNINADIARPTQPNAQAA